MRERRRGGPVIVALALAAVAGCTGGSDHRTATGGLTAPVVRDAPAVAVRTEPTSYHLVYEVRYGTGDTASYVTEEIWGRRPFDRRVEQRSGRPPGGADISLSVSTFDRSLTKQSGGAPLVLTTPPQPTPGDVHVAPVLDYARSHGYLQVREVRSVLGRHCQVLRTAVALGADALPRLQAHPRSYVDSCVDADGLMLEQAVMHGRAVEQHRVAVTVETVGPLPDSLFDTSGRPVPTAKGGGFTRQLTATSRPPGTAFWELPEPPAGFTYLGRYAVVPPQPRPRNDPGARLRIVTSITDVYAAGPDAVVVDQGGTLGGSPVFAPVADAPTVQTPAGKGSVILAASESSVRILLPRGRYVAVSGTLPPDELVALAQHLRRRPGGYLQFPKGTPHTP